MEALFKIGFTEFRINFARKSLEHNLALIQQYRHYFESQGKTCRIFADLPGPKIRVGNFEKGDEWLSVDQTFCLDIDNRSPGNRNRAYVENLRFFQNCDVGDILILASGVLLEVRNKSADSLECRVCRSGEIYNLCGISINKKYHENICLTQHDLRVLRDCEKLVDFICPSFVDSSDIIRVVKDNISDKCAAKIIAKIESPVGVGRIEAISQEADGLMLCRGDLSTFMDKRRIKELAAEFKRVTTKQKRVLVFATDYFVSMVKGEALSIDNEGDIRDALRLAPDFMIVNETSSSDHWIGIARCAMELQSRLVKT